MLANNKDYFSGLEFNKLLPQEASSGVHTFEDCHFFNLDFTSLSLKGWSFINCRFESCNLSMQKFEGVAFDSAFFVDCKLLGCDFSVARDFLFSVSCSRCILDYATFSKKKNRKSNFSNCSLQGVDLTGADFSDSTFDECNFDRAIISNTNLQGVDFRKAFNFQFDPAQNLIRKAKFSTHGLAGLLSTYGIIVSEK